MCFRFFLRNHFSCISFEVIPLPFFRKNIFKNTHNIVERFCFFPFWRFGKQTRQFALKRSLLFGEALREINRRVLTMNGMNPDPGDVVWSDILPTNVQEEINVLTSDLGNGLVSKQTASERRGYDWKSEQERMQEEAAAGDNVGAAVLRLFNQGGQ